MERPSSKYSSKVTDTQSYIWKPKPHPIRGAPKTLAEVKSPYHGLLGYVYFMYLLWKASVEIWWREFELSTRAMRKIVIIQIAFMYVFGLMFIAAGIFKSVTNIGTQKIRLDFYRGITVVALVVLVLAVLGTIGIFGPNVRVTKVFAILCFVFGHAIFTVVVSWYLLYVVDTHLSDINDAPTLSNQTSNQTAVSTTTSTFQAPKWTNETVRHIEVAASTIQYISNETVLQLYFKLLIVASVIMIIASIFTTKLLIKSKRKQGYRTILQANTPKRRAHSI